jgi:hypothetical protein
MINSSTIAVRYHLYSIFHQTRMAKGHRNWVCLLAYQALLNPQICSLKRQMGYTNLHPWFYFLIASKYYTQS